MSLVLFCKLNGVDLFCANSNTVYTPQVSHCIVEAMDLDVSKQVGVCGALLYQKQNGRIKVVCIAIDTRPYQQNFIGFQLSHSGWIVQW